MRLDVYLETGNRRTFACAVEWPGWCRSGKNEEAALFALAAYAGRYSEVAAMAGRRLPPVDEGAPVVVERVKGNATTDFGAPGVVADVDRRKLDRQEALWLRALLGASWELLDRIVAGAPEVLRKGPRGGGRDRDAVYRHVVGAETSYARQLGVKRKEPANHQEVRELREEILEAIGAAAGGSEVPAKGWPVRYAVRRCAWHVLDHAWEIQDRA